MNQEFEEFKISEKTAKYKYQMYSKLYPKDVTGDEGITEKRYIEACDEEVRGIGECENCIEIHTFDSEPDMVYFGQPYIKSDGSLSNEYIHLKKQDIPLFIKLLEKINL